MNNSFIVDAHMHVGLPGLFFAPHTSVAEYLNIMNKLGICCAICCGDNLALVEGAHESLDIMEESFQSSGQRMFYLGVYHPKCQKECLDAFKKSLVSKGFVGIKLHPSWHGFNADEDVYKPVWRFAAERDLTILTHSWSISDNNPVQKCSTPERFERFVKEFPSVRFVLAHAGGRGNGRSEAIRMVNEYQNVFMDYAGDIFCYRLIDTLLASVPAEKIIFGSDYPWLDPNANIGRVFLSKVNSETKLKVLRENAIRVYKLDS